MNPNGPYPGRQLFVGMTVSGSPAVAYLVTGRSPASRERKASPVDDGIIIGPIGDQKYDPLRHYTGLKFDNASGIIAVSNGIQTQAIFETYKLFYNTGSNPTKDFMEKILEGAREEPDSMNTPRIAGVVTNNKDGKPVFIVGSKRVYIPAEAFEVEIQPGVLKGLSTYSGDLENPDSFDPTAGLAEIEFKGKTAIELAEYLFELSKATYKDDDIRVCAVGGIRADDKKTWWLASRNR